MSRAVKIFGDAAQGSLFFEGSPHPPAPLGGVVLAAARAGSTDRIIITRSDQFQKNGVDPRVLFKRMRITRVRNKEDQRLVADLGFTQQQVIDYINDEANRKSNEIDLQKSGVAVGSANTVNFTGGGVESVSVSGDIATITISTSNAVTAIGSSTDYFYLNDGAQLSSNTHDHASGVAFYNHQLRRGEELVFSTPGNDTHVGIWNGGNGITGEANVTNKSNWQIKWEYNHSNTDWEAS